MESEIKHIDHIFVDELSDSELVFLLWGMVLGQVEIENYDDCFQEAYNRGLYNKVAIFNHHLWVDYHMKKSQYHPPFKLWVEWPDNKQVGVCNDSESSN